MFVKDGAGVRGRDTATVPHQQSLAKLGLEQRHLAAERGLRQQEDGGGAAEAARLNDLDEIAELPQVHRRGRSGRGGPDKCG